MSTIATTRILHAPEIGPSRGQRTSWVWPLPELEGLAPCILVPFGGSLANRIEVGYPGRSSSPTLVPVCATQAGIVAYAGAVGGSSTLCIDHAGGWSTQYDDLEHVLVRPTDRFRRRRKERVQAGDVIGHAARAGLRIGFALSRWTDSGFSVVNPGAWMPAWSVLPGFDVASPVRPRSRLSA